MTAGRITNRLVDVSHGLFFICWRAFHCCERRQCFSHIKSRPDLVLLAHLNEPMDRTRLALAPFFIAVISQ